MGIFHLKGNARRAYARKLRKRSVEGLDPAWRKQKHDLLEQAAGAKALHILDQHFLIAPIPFQAHRDAKPGRSGDKRRGRQTGRQHQIELKLAFGCANFARQDFSSQRKRASDGGA
jgi:hypothetical protein